MAKPREQSLDDLARRGAEGVSRREILKGAVGAAAGVALTGTFQRAKAWAATPAINCVTVAINTTAGTATPGSCTQLPSNWPTLSDVRALLQTGDILKLAQYASKKGFVPAGAATAGFITINGTLSRVVAQLPLKNSQGTAAWLAVVIDETSTPRSVMPFMPVNAPQGSAPVYVLYVDDVTGTIMAVDPVTQIPAPVTAASRSAAVNAPAVTGPALAATTTFDPNCEQLCETGCDVLGDTCAAGAGLAAGAACTPEAGPVGFVACAAVVAAICKYGGQLACNNYFCPQICGCPSGQGKCPGQLGIPTCVSLSSNPNCGTCGNSCGGNWVCAPLATGAYDCQCQAGLTECPPGGLSTECVDLNNDSSNCGSCGNACPAGVACGNGVCGCGGTSCGPPNSCCNEQCVNIQTDANNCGGCGKPCPSGASCQNGTCTCSSATGGAHAQRADATVATVPMTVCNDQCVDTTSDVNNCGSCGNVCPTGATCQSGTCQCPSGQGGFQQTVCNNQCVDTGTDAKNCGTCGTTCVASPGYTACCYAQCCYTNGGAPFCGGENTLVQFDGCSSSSAQPCAYKAVGTC